MSDGQWLEAGNHAWIRINDVRSPEWEKDLLALGHCPGLDGVMRLPDLSMLKV